MRRRLEHDAQAIKVDSELALLEQEKLALADEESRAIAARQVMNAELDEN